MSRLQQRTLEPVAGQEIARVGILDRERMQPTRFSSKERSFVRETKESAQLMRDPLGRLLYRYTSRRWPIFTTSTVRVSSSTLYTTR